jgi:Flp pilus assembly protein TadG
MHEAPSTPQARREPPRSRKALGLLSALRREQRGTAVVEFALIAIPLCLIVFGILDFGRALNYYNDLTQIAGQGARAAAVNQDPNGGAADTNFQHQLACETDSGELRRGVNIAVAYGTPLSVGGPVTVTASYTFHFLPLLKLANITLTAAQTERYESPLPLGADPARNVAGGAGTCP